MERLPYPAVSRKYDKVPFQFTEELTSKNVFLKLPDELSPFERILVQAHGNLQRILSAYYNEPSQVKIIKNNHIPNTTIPNMLFERKIEMYFKDKLVYDAESILVVRDKSVLELIEKHKYGLGQIFAHTRRSPDFVLHSVGRHGDKPGASFWRDYSLIVPDALDCFIRETFVENLFEEFDGDAKKGTIWFAKN